MTATSPRDVARWAVVAGTLGVAGAYASAFAPAPIARGGHVLMAIAIPVLLVGVLALGALPAGPVSPGSARRERRLALAFVALALWLAGGFVLALRAAPPASGSALVAGLPWPAAIVLHGVGLVPLVLLPVLFAWHHAPAARDVARASGHGAAHETARERARDAADDAS